MHRAVALTVALAGFSACNGAVAEHSPAKVHNVIDKARPLAASEAQFVAAALQAPSAGACEVLSPDPGFVEEMLLDVNSIGAPDGRRYEQRVALVVGNGAYTSVRPLANPPNDAASMAKMFRALGFTVYRAVDAGERALDECFSKFRSDLQARDAAGAKADIALFFYAGHGLQLTSTTDNEKRNYMMAVDASVDPSGKAKGFRQVDRVLSEMRAHSRQAVFLYDACRNAPYGEGAVKEADGAAVRAFDASGAAPIAADESERASQAGLFIAYATSPGKTADDGWGAAGSAHSPFTEALLESLPTPGAILEEALARSYYAVGQLTGGRQTPWTSSSLQEPMQLNGATRAADLQIRSSELAARAGKLRAEGLRGRALAEALKGLPRRWGDGAGEAARFSAARTGLFSAYDNADVRFIGHKFGVNDVAFSPDGRRVATASEDATTKIWDARSGVMLANLESSDFLRGDIRSVAFSPDGAIVATAVDSIYSSSVILWDVDAGRRLDPLPHPESVVSVAFSREGSRLASASRDWKVRIWNPKSGKLVREMEIGTGPLSVAFSPDGARLLVGTNKGEAVIHQVSSGATVRTLVGHGAPVTRAFYAPDGKRVITASEDKTVRLWDAATGATIRVFEGHARTVRDADVSPDGKRVVSVSDDRTLRLWDLETGALLRSFAESAVSVAFSPDGKRLLTSVADRTARLFEAEPGPLRIFSESACACAAMSKDGSRIAAADWEGAYRPLAAVKVWDARTGALVKTLTPVSGVVRSIAFSDDSAKVAASVSDYDLSVSSASEDTAKIWDAKSGALAATLSGHTGDIRTVRFDAPGRRLVTASEDHSAIVWDIQKAVRLQTLADPGGKWMMSAEFSPDGAEILTAGLDSAAAIWDAASGAQVERLYGHRDYVNDAVFSPDGAAVATASADRTAVIWTAPADRGSQRARIVLDHDDVVQNAAFSPDGRRIATGSSPDTARIWDARSGALLKTVAGYDDLEFSADNRTLLAVSGGKPTLWDAGLYGPDLLEAAYDLLDDDLKAEVERQRIRYWEIDADLMRTLLQ